MIFKSNCYTKRTKRRDCHRGSASVCRDSGLPKELCKPDYQTLQTQVYRLYVLEKPF